jgi:dTDP-4-dehydrorhamnose 3,5-epimerase
VGRAGLKRAMLDIRPLAFPDVRLIRAKPIADIRGHFVEMYTRRDFAAAGIAQEFIQDNQSRSHAGTVRGLHFQIFPFGERRHARNDGSLHECLDIVSNQPERAYAIAEAGMRLRSDPRFGFGEFHNVIELARRSATAS